MPTFSYRCARGHVTDQFFTPGEPRTATSRCGKCRRRATYSLNATLASSRLYTIPDVPEHWNTSIDQPVRSRRHLRDLQKRNGWQTYEPVKRKPHKIPVSMPGPGSMYATGGERDG